nr:uncharacterized protein LOC109152212 [Ipomoea trifida]
MKIEKRFSKIKGVISVVAEAKKKWVHIAGTADLGKLLHTIEKKGRKVEVIYYCKMNLSNYQPTKEDKHGDKTPKHGSQKHYCTSTTSTKSTEKNSFRRKKEDEKAEAHHFACGDSDDNGNDYEYEDAHAKYKSRVHRRESHSAAAAPRVARPPSPPWAKAHVRGFGDDFMDADVAYHLRKMRSTVPQAMSQGGYVYEQPPPPQYGGYYGRGSSYPAAYEAAPPPAYQYGYSPY